MILKYFKNIFILKIVFLCVCVVMGEYVNHSQDRIQKILKDMQWEISYPYPTLPAPHPYPGILCCYFLSFFFKKLFTLYCRIVN